MNNIAKELQTVRDCLKRILVLRDEINRYTRELDALLSQIQGVTNG